MPRIRPALPDDLPRVLEVYAQGIATGDATFETELPDPDALWERWLPGHAWVAELDGRVVGWAPRGRLTRTGEGPAPGWIRILPGPRRRCA